MSRRKANVTLTSKKGKKENFSLEEPCQQDYCLNLVFMRLHLEICVQLLGQANR